MPLLELPLPPFAGPVPADVAALLKDADRRVRRFQANSKVHGFVPSDFTCGYRALRALSEANLAPGGRFCEWGCGFGVVACLAALLDFDASGIEIDDALVAEAQRFADDHGLPVEYLRGSFIPKSAERFLDASFAAAGEGFSWLTTESEGSLEQQGMAPDDFDVIYAYPWPDEEKVVAGLFERTAADGALLLTHHSGDAFRLRRKTAPRKRAERRDSRPRRR